MALKHLYITINTEINPIKRITKMKRLRRMTMKMTMTDDEDDNE